MTDLREQLLKAGLVNKKAKQKADAAARRRKKQQRKQSKTRAADERAEARRKAQYEARMARQAEASRTRAAAEQEKRLAKERRNRLYNLALSWQDRGGRGDRSGRGGRDDRDDRVRRWYFVTRQGRIARLEVSLEQAWRLEVGALAIVEKTGDRDEPHVLVSWEGAEKIQKLEPEAVRFWNRRGEGVGFVAPGSK